MTESATASEPPDHLTEQGRESWRRRQRLEQQRLERLAVLKVKFEQAHAEWVRLREHYRANEPAYEVLGGHEPRLDSGGGWAIRMPGVYCEACEFQAEDGEKWGGWPCWTYELLAGLAADDTATNG